MIQKTKTTITVHPRPDSAAAASGKKIILERTYYPIDLSSDSSSPELPVVYHDLLKFYVAYLCYSGKLKDPNELAPRKLKLFQEQIKLLQGVVDKETEEGYAFGFGLNEGLDSASDYGIYP